MITQQEMQELRQDCLNQAREDEMHECMMRSDLDYFLAKSNYNDALDSLVILKSEAEMYDRCIHELIEAMQDELRY